MEYKKKKYIYIVVGCADEYYEENIYFKKFYSYNGCYNYLKKHNYNYLLEKLKYLNSIKTSYCSNIIVISYN